MNWIQRYKLRNYVRNSVWLLSVFAMLAGLVSVKCLHWIEVRAGWQSGFDPDAARAMFGTLAGAMFTFIVFLSSILLLVVQLASAQLTPRFIGTVFRDRVTRFALTRFAFTFTFTLAVLMRIHTSVPTITGYVSAYLCLISLGVFLFLIDHVGKALRPSGALRAMARLGHEVIQSVYPRRLSGQQDTGHRPVNAPGGRQGFAGCGWKTLGGQDPGRRSEVHDSQIIKKTPVVKRHTKLTILGSALACGALLPLSSQAGGIFLYEIATPDVGLASAGYAARAQDASTVFRNPAGMSLLSGSQFQGGAQLTYGNVAFSPDASTASSGDNGGNAVGALPAAGLFFTHQLSDRFAVGFGAFSYFGLMENFNDDWVGRYYIQKGSLLGMSLMPAASFKATDWLSIGAGLNAMYGYMDTEVAIRTGVPGDGQLKLKDQTWGFGANVGVLIEPRKGTRFGVTYLSPVNLDFKATPSFSNLGPLGGAVFANPSQLNLGITVPQSVMLSAYHELSPKWAILANVGWQNWSQFGKVDVGVDSANPSSLTKNLKYDDTWHGAIGAQYRASEKWLLSAGLACDTSAVSDANRTLSLPMGQAYRLGLGAQWQVSKAIGLGAAYEFMWAGDMPVTC